MPTVLKTLIEFIPIISFIMMFAGGFMWILQEFAGDGSAIPLAKRFLIIGGIVFVLSGLLVRFVL